MRYLQTLQILGVVALLGGCSSITLPLDAVLVSGRARAGKVRRDSELIGGPIAFGRTDDVWKLYNTKARFLIQDVGTSVGLGLYGGNLIDNGDRAPRRRRKNGNDLFRDVPIVGLHVQDPKSVELVSDGRDGWLAILRFRGIDAPSNILPQLDDIALDLGGEIVTDYILDPDVAYLKVVTSYKAREGQSIASLGLGDFLAFGSALTLFQPENGFEGQQKTVSFLAGTADRTSYGYVYPDGDLQLILVDASGTAGRRRLAGGAHRRYRFIDAVLRRRRRGRQLRERADVCAQKTAHRASRRRRERCGRRHGRRCAGHVVRRAVHGDVTSSKPGARE